MISKKNRRSIQVRKNIIKQVAEYVKVRPEE